MMAAATRFAPAEAGHHQCRQQRDDAAVEHAVGEREDGLPATPTDLARWPRVNDAERKGWALWFQAQGMDDTGPARGPSFDDASLLPKSVPAGQGAALLPLAVAASEIAEGRLVQLSDATWLEDFAYSLVYPESSEARPKVVALREGLLEVARNAPAVVAAKRTSSAGRKRSSSTFKGKASAPSP